MTVVYTAQGHNISTNTVAPDVTQYYVAHLVISQTVRALPCGAA